MALFFSSKKVKDENVLDSKTSREKVSCVEFLLALRKRIHFRSLFSFASSWDAFMPACDIAASS